MFGPDDDRPPFIGRQSELEMVSKAATASAGKASHVILATGSTGAGITRLCEEIHGRMASGYAARAKTAVMLIDGSRLGHDTVFEFLVGLRNQFVRSGYVFAMGSPIELRLVGFDTLAAFASVSIDLRRPEFELSRARRTAGALARVGKAATAGMWDLAEAIVELSNLAQAGIEEAAGAASGKVSRRLVNRIRMRLATMGNGPAARLLRDILSSKTKPTYAGMMEALAKELFIEMTAGKLDGGAAQLYLIVDAFDMVNEDAAPTAKRYKLAQAVREGLDALSRVRSVSVVGGRRLAAGGTTVVPDVDEMMELEDLSWVDLERAAGTKVATFRSRRLTGELANKSFPAAALAREWKSWAATS